MSGCGTAGCGGPDDDKRFVPDRSGLKIGASAARGGPGLAFAMTSHATTPAVETARPDWFADESFWATSHPFMFPASKFEVAITEVPQIIALTGQDTGSLLDVACGPGRYAVPFARRGFTVTAIDSTPFLLDKAREYGAAQNVDVEWIPEDMRRFTRPDAFDLAINLYTSLGFFDDPADNQHVLERVHNSLRAKGVFVIDVVGKEIIARKFQQTGSHVLPDGTMVVQRRTLINSWSGMENEWLFVKDDAVKRYRIRHWLYSGQELKHMLMSAGFDHVELFGDYGGAPYGPDARRLVAVARKGTALT